MELIIDVLGLNEPQQTCSCLASAAATSSIAASVNTNDATRLPKAFVNAFCKQRQTTRDLKESA